MKRYGKLKTETRWRICAIAAPFALPESDSHIHAASFISLLEPLAEELFVITSHFPKNLISSKRVHIISVIPNEKSKSMLLRIPRFFTFQLRVSNRLYKIRNKIDILILGPGASSMVLPTLLAKLLGKKVILLRHGTGSFPQVIENLYEGTLFGLGKNFFPQISDMLIGFNCCLSNRLAVFTSEITDPRLRRYAAKISRGSRFYTDTNFFRITKSYSTRKYTLGYLGRFEDTKGVMNFVKAFPMIFREYSDAMIIMGGDGSLRNNIEEEIKNICSGDKVILTGWITHSGLPECLNDIQLLVIPSPAEAGPQVAFEAMACGTCVLATPVGIIPDVIKDGETGFIMDDNSPECITRNIARVLNYPDLNRITRAARALVEKEYTHKAAVERYRDIFTGLE